MTNPLATREQREELRRKLESADYDEELAGIAYPSVRLWMWRNKLSVHHALIGLDIAEEAMRAVFVFERLNHYYDSLSEEVIEEWPEAAEGVLRETLRRWGEWVGS